MLNASSSSHANYKAYLETILSYDKTAKDSHLRAQIFAMDTPGHYNTKLLEGEPNEINKGYKERNVMIRNSRTFDVISPIQSDFLR